MLYKIHKPPTPRGYPTRPVCSDVSSLPRGLGKWVDIQLQPVARTQPSYFQDSYCLKQLLSNIEIPPYALLFTADAKSMYTNIRTGPALKHISNLLRNKEGRTFHHYDAPALIEALEIVFKNNILQFGDTYWKQISGTGMGIAPTPPWAAIYIAIHENSVLSCWTSQVLFYRRFIDDIIGIWVCDKDPERNNALWTQFTCEMQQWHGLEWEFSPLSQSCNYMDLTLTLSIGTIHSTLFEKSQNLYLIYPHTPHIQGGLSRVSSLEIFYGYTAFVNPPRNKKTHPPPPPPPTNRGHHRATLTPLFHKATIKKIGIHAMYTYFTCVPHYLHSGTDLELYLST
eukprot:CCRYP_002186-RB/>CCRYP_002186-RB protein AED:0.29 eAED:0.21 QI:0/-1/0/1/-1/0/1/0/339